MTGTRLRRRAGVRAAQEVRKEEVEEVLKMGEDLQEGQPRKVKFKKRSDEERYFRQAREDELRGVFKDGAFILVKASNITGHPRIFGSRFVDELKWIKHGLRNKSRLVAQNVADEGATFIATKAPTVQRFLERICLSLTASLPTMTAYARDITQAYIQSSSNLERAIYMLPPPELRLSPGDVLKVVKPLYGILESGLHWYLTYLTHHIDTFSIKLARADPCVLYRCREGSLDGRVLLQVDD